MQPRLSPAARCLPARLRFGVVGGNDEQARRFV